MLYSTTTKQKKMKVVKVDSLNAKTHYVHTAFNKDGTVRTYFLLPRLHDVAPIDPKDLNHVKKIAKTEALDKGFVGVRVTSFDFVDDK